MKPKYIEKLKNELKIVPQNDQLTSNDLQKLLCLLCNNYFDGIPKDKLQKYKKHKLSGCPECITSKRREIEKNNTIAKLLDFGYEITGEYCDSQTPTEIRKVDCCGRSWISRPHNILIKRPQCKPCKDDRRNNKKNNVTHKEDRFDSYLKKLKDSASLLVLPPYKNASTHHDIKCLLCGDIFIATPKSKMNNFKNHNLSGCSSCTRFKTHEKEIENNIQTIKNMGYEIITPYTGKNNKFVVKNIKCCGREWTTKPSYILSGNSFCRPCNDDKKRKRFNEQNKIRHETSLKNMNKLEAYRKRVRVLTERNYIKYKDLINPKGLIRGRSGQSDVYHLDHVYPLQYCFYHSVPENVAAGVDNLQMLPWEENARKWKVPIHHIPQSIKPYVSTSNKYDEFYSSVLNEFDSLKFIKNHSPDNTDINIPLYFPDVELGIMFVCFDDFVEQKIGTKSYLKRVKKSFNELGLRHIIVFEDEWQNNRKLVLKKLKHLLKLNSDRIYARKCEIKEIKKTSDFLREHHIQGPDQSNIKLGAFYKEELIAVMTFCKPRKFMNKNKIEGVWELSRFAAHSDYIVSGIGSKLLSFFIKNYKWTQIYSYADMRWSNGNVYEKLGFIGNGETVPNYFYLVEGTRKHRYGFRKNVLNEKLETFDSTKTEYQNMLENGYDRIWDCGHLKYVMNKE